MNNINVVNKDRTPELCVTATHTHYPFRNKPTVPKSERNYKHSTTRHFCQWFT